MTLERRTAPLAGRGEEGRARAMARFAVLRPHLEEGVPLARAAGEAGVTPPTRTKPACRRERRSVGWRATVATGWRVSRVPCAAMPARTGHPRNSWLWSRA